MPWSRAQCTLERHSAEDSGGVSQKRSKRPSQNLLHFGREIRHAKTTIILVSVWRLAVAFPSNCLGTAMGTAMERC